MPQVGEELAGYRLLAVLGRGGMSVVYQAENPRIGSQVALKLLAPELANNDLFRARFLQESRIAASLNHPNVIPIYDMGSHRELLYIAMRYVAGSDAHSLLHSRGRLAPNEAVYLVSQAGRALDFAHKRGLVHRDVKPANILVERGVDEDDPDHVYLADFGISKHHLSRTGLTPTGQFMGTLDYVAPEQIQGTVVDGRSDIYSLGCVLYELTTGQVPFVKDLQAALLYAHVEEPPPSPRAVRPDLPVAFDSVIAKALAKDPDERFATCRELVDSARLAFQLPDEHAVSLLDAKSHAQPAEPLLRFRGAHRSEPGTPTTDVAPPVRSSAPQPVPPPPGNTATAPRKPSRVLLALGAVLVLAVGLAGAGFWWGSHHDDRPVSSSPAATDKPHMTHSATPSALSRALQKANSLTNGRVPPSKCDSMAADHVMCQQPAQNIHSAEFRTYPTLNALYQAYVTRARQLAGGPFKTNSGDCLSTRGRGEVSWNHEYQHPRKFSLADSRANRLMGGDASGRVFCRVNDAGDETIVWTMNKGKMLGVVVAHHTVVFAWWKAVHHNIEIGPGMDQMHSHGSM
jgi:serine/threonine-protein kinase